jgi:hypothetical protein
LVLGNVVFRPGSHLQDVVVRHDSSYLQLSFQCWGS